MRGAVRWARHGRGQRWTLGAIVLLGLALRLGAAWRWNLHQPDSAARLVGDEPGYDNLALNLLAGNGYVWIGRVPLYPLWLAAVHAASGRCYAAIPYAQAVLSLATIGLTYVLARRLFGSGAALLAALAAAVSHVLIVQPLRVMSEVLFTPIVLLVVLALERALRAPAGRRWLGVGVWTGVSALVRPTLLFFPVFLAGALPLLARWQRGERATAWRSTAWRAAGLTVVGTLVTVAPWIARNYVRTGAVFPLATSNALLWQGSPEYYHLVRDSGYTYMRVWTEVLYGPGWRARDPMSVAGERYWTRRALRSIAREPLVYARYAAAKALYYWVGDPNADWNDERIFSYGALRRAGYGRQAALDSMVARALIVPALLAAWILRRRWRALLALYLVLVYCTLLHALTHAEVRLSEPLQPLLLVLVSGAASTVVARWQASRTAAPRALPAVPAPVR